MIPSFRCVDCITQLDVVCKLAEGAFDLTVYVIDEDVKQHWSHYDRWGTPLVTSLHLDIEPLITTLWMRPSQQFLTHWTVRPSNPYLSNLERPWGTMSKALQLSRQMTFIALPLSTGAVTPSQKAMRLVRQDLPLVKPYWLSQITPWPPCASV